MTRLARLEYSKSILCNELDSTISASAQTSTLIFEKSQAVASLMEQLIEIEKFDTQLRSENNAKVAKRIK